LRRWITIRDISKYKTIRGRIKENRNKYRKLIGFEKESKEEEIKEDTKEEEKEVPKKRRRYKERNLDSFIIETRCCFTFPNHSSLRMLKIMVSRRK
jgi:hypothetical protein